MIVDMIWVEIPGSQMTFSRGIFKLNNSIKTEQDNKTKTTINTDIKSSKWFSFAHNKIPWIFRNHGLEKQKDERERTMYDEREWEWGKSQEDGEGYLKVLIIPMGMNGD